MRQCLFPHENTSKRVDRYAPRQIKNAQYSDTGRLNVEVKFAPFSSIKRRAHLRVRTIYTLHLFCASNSTDSTLSQDVEDRTIAQLVHQSLLPAVQLHLFPKSSIDIFIEIIENDGLEGCVASASIAASTALVDAGIEMQGMVVACCAVSEFSSPWCRS